MKNETELESPHAAAGVADTERDEAREAEGELPAELTWSPGALVRRARESRDLSPEALSLQTKLPVRTLRALETDDFDALSEPVFVRGYYRRCAHVLGIPSGEVVRAYERASGEPPPQPMPLKASVGEEDLHTRNWLPYVVFALIIGGLAALIVWWGEQDMAANLLGSRTADAPAATSAAPPGATEPAVATVEPVELTASVSDNPARGPVTAMPQPAVGDGAAAEAADPSPATASATVPASAAGAVAESNAAVVAVSTAAAGTDAGSSAGVVEAALTAGAGTVPAAPAPTLLIDFSQKSWVRITDATGERLLNGLIPGGTQRELAGEPPFDVLLGYAPGVDMRFGGEPIALEPYIQSNNTARLTVGGP